MSDDDTSQPQSEEPLIAAQIRESDAIRTSQRRSTVAWALAVLFGAAVILVIATMIPRRGTDEAAPTRHHKVDGKRLANLRLESLDGTSKLVLEDLRGKVFLINLWGPWCSACYLEIPHLKALQKRLADNSAFSLISVSCGPDTRSEDVAQLRIDTVNYLQQQAIPFPTFMDVSGQTREAIVEAAELQETGIAYPLNVVVDRDGIIRGLWMGYRPGVEQEIATTIDHAL